LNTQTHPKLAVLSPWACFDCAVFVSFVAFGFSY
jgi:hypothetical protein